MENEDSLHADFIKIRPFSITLSLYKNQFFTCVRHTNNGIICHERKSIKPPNLNHNYFSVEILLDFKTKPF